jgi:hypothetical protein
MASPPTSTSPCPLHRLTERLATTLLLHPPLPKGQERRFAAALACVDDEVVALGGPTGGWSAREHGVFLKLWKEFRGGEEVVEEGGRGMDPVAQVTGNLRLLDRAAVALRGGKRCGSACVRACVE